MVRVWARSVCVLLIFISTKICAAEAPQEVIDKHKAAVDQAREGDERGGLKALDAIIQQNPDFYPAKRDYVIIATWLDDCDTALTAFSVLRDESPLEGYLVAPIADCLRNRRQLDQAKALLETAVNKNPQDEEARQALNDLNDYIRLESRPTIYAQAGFNESDQGNKEWQAELKYSQEITRDMRAYYRHLVLQADDPQFATGDVSRAGLGLLTWFGVKYLLDVEVFTDVDIKDQEGARVNLSYYPNQLWEFSVDYTSSTTDTPLRARADPNHPNTKAVRTQLNSAYHSKDYRWEWSANYGRYHFNDTNERDTAGTSLGYAYQLQPEHEQRVIFELYGSQNQSTNPALDVLYYNPEQDWSATISLRASNVYASRFERLADHFTVYTGLYKQKGLPPGGRDQQGGGRYELEIGFNRRSSLNISLEYGAHVYDGVSELQSGFSIAYNQKL